MIRLRADQALDLTPAEVDENWVSIARASVPITIDAAGAITIPGSGRYKVLPNSGTTDDLDSIILTGENVEGTFIQLRPATAGHIITVRHQGNFHLAMNQNQALSTIFTTLWLRHYGSNVWAQEGTVTFTT